MPSTPFKRLKLESLSPKSEPKATTQIMTVESSTSNANHASKESNINSTGVETHACNKFIKRAHEMISKGQSEAKKKKQCKAWERQAPLREYEQDILGVDLTISKTEQIGKCCERENIDTVGKEEHATICDTAICKETSDDITLQETIERINWEADEDAKRRGLPTAAELASTGFGKPSKNHSFTQEASGETIIFTFLKYGARYLNEEELCALRNTHPLIEHISNMIKSFKRIDFSALREYDRDYATRTEIPKERIKMFMACLYHYDLSIANVMRYVGNNYTGAYRDIQKSVKRMRGLVDDDLLTLYIQVMLVGAPSHFVAETSRENTLEYLRNGNHPSVDKNMGLALKTVRKMEQHQFVIPLHMYISRWIPHIFFTPHHILEKLGKAARMICDSSRRYTPKSKPLNMMTSTRNGVELECQYGNVLQRILIRIWKLRQTYPKRDIIIHANDVKSCFRQIKHHPDVMAAFSYIIGDMLYLSAGQTMGSDFSPATWEVCRRIAEQLCTKLFEEKDLRKKHRKYLDNLQWSKKLGHGREEDFTQAPICDIYNGVLDEYGNAENCPHHLFVDDDIYAEVYDVDRIEQSIAAGIEGIFILLGESNLEVRQDPIAWDKLYEMIIHFKNTVLGYLVNTREMTLEVPPEYIARVNKLLLDTWHKGRKSFTVKEAETLTGVLAHIANTAPWLRHLLGHLYTSIAAALGNNTSYLINTNKHFREELKKAKMTACGIEEEMEISFAQGNTARKIHNLKRKHHLNQTMIEEISIIRDALSSKSILKAQPIAHAIPNRQDAICYGDSSLNAAGGWSTDMGFWWYVSWPQKVRSRTIRYLKNGKSKELVDINAMEYATIIINFAASVHYWITQGHGKKKGIKYPLIRCFADNTSSESWTVKGCKRSFTGRRLARLQCALMINNPVGLTSDRVDTETNDIADKISRWDNESDVIPGFASLSQEYPQLKCLRRFHPSKELISLVTDALLSEKLVDPLTLSQKLLADPGKLAS